MQQGRPEDQFERFIHQCREHRLRITPQRVSLFKALMKSDRHPSATDLFQVVRSEFTNISLDTVNRTLQTFARIGLIDVVEGPDAPRRYDANRESHHHFICVDCGAIIDFFDQDFDRLPVPEAIRAQAVIHSRRVVITGLCRQCRDKKESNIKGEMNE